jgi:ribosome-associated translation inhibitor RaiA
MELQITFRHMEPSPAAEARVRKLAAGLERFGQITHCSVVLELPAQHRHKGGPYSVKIDLRVPGREICVDSERDLHGEHTDLHVAIRDAFRAVRRQLEDHVRERRGDVKHHAPARTSGST